jgi:hypothetical protein
MTVGTRLMVVAYDGITMEAYTEYEIADVSGAITPVGSAVGMVIPAGSYRFVAYSLNTNDPLSYAATMGPYTAGSDDVLWGETPVETLVDGVDYNITIPMYHQFSRVTVVATSIDMSPYTIDDLEAEVLGYQAKLIPKDGLVKDAAENQAFTSFSTLGNATVTSDMITVYTGGESTTAVRFTTVTMGAITHRNRVARFNRKLEPGKSYTLKVSFKELFWAKSNIYWETVSDVNDAKYPGYLTFAPAEANDSKAGYQGVFFKWGSLVGVSPAQATNGSNAYAGQSVPIYVPYNYTDNAPAAAKWRASTNATEYTTWGAIPYLTEISYTGGYTGGDYTISNTYAIDPERNTEAMYQGLRGDICQYISKTGAVSGKYRLPIASEFGPAKNTNFDTSGLWTQAGVFSEDNSLGNPEGTFDLYGTSGGHRGKAKDYLGSVDLPAAGERTDFGGSGGGLRRVALNGLYWTGSEYSDYQLYTFEIHYDFVGYFDSFERTDGRPLRCVRN